MKSLLNPDGRFNDDGVRFIQSLIAVQRPVFAEYVQKGYSLQSIEEQAHQAIDFLVRSVEFEGTSTMPLNDSV